MLRLDRYKGFEWDSGNVDKNYWKHGIFPSEAEEIFLDKNLVVVRDVKHSQSEIRYVIVGETIKKKLLFVVFTTRGEKIRIISARTANKKEEDKYVSKV